MLSCKEGPVGEEIPRKYPPLYCELTGKKKKKKIRIDPMQTWLPLNYSFVHIQKSLISYGLVQDNKFFRILISKMRLVRLF